MSIEFQLNKDQCELQSQARVLASTKFAQRAAEIDSTEQYPYDNVKDLVAAKFMGMTIPKEFGGEGSSLIDAVLVIEQIASACATTGRIAVDSNAGVVSAIIHYGTQSQKEYWLPLIVQGDKPCICITEHDAGSDATALQTTITQSDDRYIINGRKWFITGAGVSRTHLVLGRMGTTKGGDGIGGILVEKDTPGFEVLERIPSMGIRGLWEADISFEDCSVPATNLLVPAGPGSFRKLMTAYNSQRIASGAVALGIAQGAYDLAVSYAKRRKQFGQALSEFQGIQWMLADMHIALEAARALIYKAAANAPLGLPDMTEAAIAKTFTAEMAIQVTNQALQIHGSYGYSRDLPLERMVRDARMFTIAGGTTQIMRNMIARSILKD
jgi:alkylation response protein AidB-like acyl-CoA dehydrogenase